MKASKMLIATMKETPTEAQISSHILLLRAGMIRKLVAGVYNYLPLGLRVLNKVENIIREEMDNVNKSPRSVFNGFKWRPIRSHESHEFNDCALVELGAMCLEDGKNMVQN